jgi:hypothetical protein
MLNLLALRLSLAPLLLLIVLAAGCATRETPSASLAPSAAADSAIATLPFEDGAGNLLLPVRLNGQGPYWALLDTGAAGTTLYRDTAEALGLTVEPHGVMTGLGPDTLPVGKAGGLTITLEGEGTAAASLDEPSITVLPAEARLPAFGDKEIDVILGASLFERFVVAIDFASHRLTLHDPQGYRSPDGAGVLPIQLTQGYPHAEGSVTVTPEPGPQRTIAGRFLIDLGSPLPLQIEHGAAVDAGLLDDSIENRTLVGQIAGIDGSPLDLFALPAADLTLGGQSMEVRDAMLLPVAGGGPPIDGLVATVGAGAFAGRLLTIDYPNRRLLLR